jgi:hypothetical protein
MKYLQAFELLSLRVLRVLRGEIFRLDMIAAQLNSFYFKTI